MIPRPSFDATGLTVPAEADIVAGLGDLFQSAFGGALNLSPATPQGQLIASLAAEFGAANDLLLSIVNQVDPAFADGRMQDAIGRIYFLQRKGPVATTVQCLLTGASGTLIAAGSLAQASDGTIYQSVSAVTIPPSGAVTTTFQAIDSGPISCPAGTLTTIYRIVPGWDTIYNPGDGVLGRDAETRSAFEARRAQSVAINATGHLPAMRAALLNVPGVIDAYVVENATASTVTVGGVLIAAHSLYAAAYGGADSDVARAIWTKKPPGCGYTGNTTVTVTDIGSGYQSPYPSYPVTFERPAALPIYIAVTLANNGLTPANATTLVQDAVTAAFVGDDGGPPARIGSTLYALRFVAGIAALGVWAQVISVTIGTSAAPTAADVTVPINAMPTLDPSHVTVALA